MNPNQLLNSQTIIYIAVAVAAFLIYRAWQVKQAKDAAARRYERERGERPRAEPSILPRRSIVREAYGNAMTNFEERIIDDLETQFQDEFEEAHDRQRQRRRSKRMATEAIEASWLTKNPFEPSPIPKA